MLWKRLTSYSVFLLDVSEEKITVTSYCIDTVMMMNKDNNDTREKSEWT